jgi:DNA-binding response OmpR family regulator
MQVEESSMKVISCCSQALTARLARYLAAMGVAVLGAASPAHALALARQEGCQVILVDASREDVAAVCRFLGQGGIPVVLVAEGRHPDWPRLEPLDADGFILEEHGWTEIAARLRAVVRRRTMLRVESRK